MMSMDDETLDALFRALSDTTRRTILFRLLDRDRSLSEIAHPLNMTLAGVAKHVVHLERAGLVSSRVVGRRRIVSIVRSPLVAIDAWLQGYFGLPA